MQDIEENTLAAEKRKIRSSSPIPQKNEQRLNEIWKQAYAARTNEDLKDLYANWADTYDEDHYAIGYFGHVTASQILAEYLPDRGRAKILDAGAGTGIAGEELASLGFRDLTAIDLSADMLDKAKDKGVYGELHAADLGQPLDRFGSARFDAAVLVGVFSYGQAPAHALEELVRVVKPGGVIAFTMRTDFYETDAMGVRSKIEQLEREGAWELAEITEPQQYLPKKDPKAMFCVWCYRLLAAKAPVASDGFKKAVAKAFATKSAVKAIDHSYIWDAMASRLYNQYIECPDYYLPDCEEEILRVNADDIIGVHSLIVELGCGSAQKIKHLFDAHTSNGSSRKLVYVPIDVSKEALVCTEEEVKETFEEQVKVCPLCGRFDDKLEEIPADIPKSILFFGSSIGNIESVEDTISFLKRLKERMTPNDRLVVGVDLHKEQATMLRAYNAGPANRSFFLNMVRRINYELGADFDLEAFRLGSTYHKETAECAISPWLVGLKVVTEKNQDVYISELDTHIHMNAGDAVRVGVSRKFAKEEIRQLGDWAGLLLKRQWLDSKGFYSLNEFVWAPATQM